LALLIIVEPFAPNIQFIYFIKVALLFTLLSLL